MSNTEMDFIRLQACNKFGGQYLDDQLTGYIISAGDLIEHFVCFDDGPDRPLEDIVNLKADEGITLLVPVEKTHIERRIYFRFTGRIPVSEAQYERLTQGVPEHARNCVVP